MPGGAGASTPSSPSATNASAIPAAVSIDIQPPPQSVLLDIQPETPVPASKPRIGVDISFQQGGTHLRERDRIQHGKDAGEASSKKIRLPLGPPRASLVKIFTTKSEEGGGAEASTGSSTPPPIAASTIRLPLGPPHASLVNSFTTKGDHDGETSIASATTTSSHACLATSKTALHEGPPPSTLDNFSTTTKGEALQEASTSSTTAPSLATSEMVPPHEPPHATLDSFSTTAKGEALGESSTSNTAPPSLAASEMAPPNEPHATLDNFSMTTTKGEALGEALPSTTSTAPSLASSEMAPPHKPHATLDNVPTTAKGRALGEALPSTSTPPSLELATTSEIARPQETPATLDKLDGEASTSNTTPSLATSRIKLLGDRRATLDKLFTKLSSARLSNLFVPGISFPILDRGSFDKFFKRSSIIDALTTLKNDSQTLEQLAEKAARNDKVQKLLKDGFQAYAEKYGHLSHSLPSQVIKFKNITYTNNVMIAEKKFPTVGSTFLDLLPHFKKRRRKKFCILNNCSGYLMPGTITLLCGPPGCGKTSLHKALSGRLVVEKGSTYSGQVTYNGKAIKDIFISCIASYIPQLDWHYPRLTVYETCMFAYECMNIRNKGLAYARVEGVKRKLTLEIILRILALTHVADTMVGDDFVRGLSGGERHRVSIAEMVADTYMSYFLDEVSTGQDSSASYQILSSFFAYARKLQTACLISICQPTEEVFELCDRIIVLVEGQIIYQGPREDVLQYFAQLGYVKPSHIDTADFLQEVTTPEGRIFLQPGFKHLDTENFVKAYECSDSYKDVMRVLNDPRIMQLFWCRAEKPLGLTLRDQLQKAGDNVIEVCEVDPKGNISTLRPKYHTAKVKVGDIITGVPGKNGMLQYISGTHSMCFADDVRRKVSLVQGHVRLQLERMKEESSKRTKVMSTKFVQNHWESMKTVLARQSKLLRRDKSHTLARLLQVIIYGVTIGTLFYQVPPGPDRPAMDLRRSLGFIACLNMFVSSVSHIPGIIAERKVFEKQYSAKFFRPSTYIIAITVAQFPYFVAEVLLFCPLFYWLTGLSSAKHGAHFLLFTFLALECSLTGAALSRFSASICRTVETATSLAGVMVIISIIFAGYTVTKNKIPHWWIWAYYLSPLQYSVTGLVCNEFLSATYNQPCTSAISYCEGRMDLTVGKAYLNLYDMPTTYFTGVWASVIGLLMFYIALSCMTFWSMAHLRFVEVKLPSSARLLGQAGIRKELPNFEQKTMDINIRPPMEEATSSKSLPSIMEFQPFLLSFHHMYYEVLVPREKTPKVLLNGVSGYAKPGTMTALMGSSGAGKTTLLDVLAGRKTIGKMRGEILLNGFQKQHDTFARVSGYVEQNNIHQHFVTVKEALEFSATLRLPRSTSISQRKAFVKEVTLMLELEDIQNNLVGSIGDSGLSLEEAKRLTIGVELVANPSIIFFDEPTTGLDSRSAQIVIRGVKKIVQSGRTVICTIHQPSKRLFFAFDQLLMLKKGGEVAYFGKIGPEAKDILDYFHGLPGMTKFCKPDQNPATYIVDLIIGDRVTLVEHRDFSADYQGSTLRTTNWLELEKIQHGRGTLGPAPSVKGYAASWPIMVSTVLSRQFTTYWRNVDYNFLRLAFSFCFAIFLGSSFWQIKYDTTPGLVSRSGLIYISISLITTASVGTIISQVNAERPLYYRETASNMYSSLVYGAAWALGEMVYLTATTLVFCSICFAMAGVSTNNGSIAVRMWLLFNFYTSSVTCYGLAVAMMTPNDQIASVIVPVVTNLWNWTCGFLIYKDNFPHFWTWLYWFNPTQFVLTGAMKLAFYCDTSNANCRSCSLDPNTGTCLNCNCIHVSDQDGVLAWFIVKSQFSLNEEEVTGEIGILAAFTIFFFSSGLIALRFLKFNKR